MKSSLVRVGKIKLLAFRRVIYGRNELEEERGRGVSKKSMNNILRLRRSNFKLK